MHLAQLGLILAAFGGSIAVLNWTYGFLTWRTGRLHSLLPLFGGGMLALGMALLPRLRPYAWCGLVADPWTFVIPATMTALARELWRTSPVNQVAEYSAREANRMVTLRLYRYGNAALIFSFDRPPEEHGTRILSLACAWWQDDHRLILRMGNDELRFEPSPAQPRQIIRCGGKLDAEESPEFSLDGVELQLHERT